MVVLEQSKQETDYFTKKLHKIHNSVCSQLPSQKDITKTKLQELETHLNKVFYSKENGDNELKNKILKQANDALSGTIDKALESLNELPEKDLTEEDMKKAIQSEYEVWNHTQSIQRKTLETRRESVKVAMDNLTQNGNAVEEKYKDLYTKMQKYCAAVNDFLQGYGENIEKINIKGESEVFETVKALDEAYKEISVSNSLSTKTIGDILEIVLGYYSLEMIDAQTQQLVDVVTGGKKTSSEKEARTKTSKLKKEGKTTKKTTYTFGQGKQALTIEVNPDYTDNVSRSQKMDVKLFLPNSEDNSAPLRVSAKNWASLDGDFGSTPIAYAVTRSFNKAFGTNSTSLANSNSLLSQTFYGLSGQNNLQNIHNLVKYSIAADILMGYSQSEGYADTIIINVRSKSRLYVISIKKLLKSIYKNITDFKVHHYNEKDIETKVKDILSWDRGIYEHAFNDDIPEKDEDENQAKRELVLRYLQSIDTSIHFSAIKAFSGIS